MPGSDESECGSAPTLAVSSAVEWWEPLGEHGGLQSDVDRSLAGRSPPRDVVHSVLWNERAVSCSKRKARADFSILDVFLDDHLSTT